MRRSEHILSVYRVIPNFIRLMVKQMMRKKNLKKQHWGETCDYYLMDRLTTKAHYLEEQPLSAKAARLACVDIANLAMMLHDNLKNAGGK